jgi:hypothetical protein
MEQFKMHAVRLQRHIDGETGKEVSVGTLLDTYVLRLSETELEMTEWINYLVMKNQPLCTVDCPITRKIVRLKEVCAKSVRKHILSLVSVVRDEIKARLPDKLVLIFDGWTEGTDHYIGIWASYNLVDSKDDSEKETTVQTLLSIRPLLADGIEGMTASDHLRHIKRVLELYDKDESNVICLMGDNCSVNQSMARTMSVPLIGCASHKFNIAVRHWMEFQPQLTTIIKKVAAVMKKASTLKVAAKLRQQTKLACVKENDTRWSSTYNMVRRFFQIQGQLNALVEVLSLLPTPVEVDALSRGFKLLVNFNAITVMLQGEKMSFVKTRNIFNVLIADFPEMEHHLGTESHLVTDTNFEMGVMCLAGGMPLTQYQLTAVANLAKTDERGGDAAFNNEMVDTEDRGEDESYAVRVVKRLKMQMQEHTQREKYMTLDIIPGTSVNCERLFSLAKHILTDTRKNTSPLLFEALLFLKVNRNLWDAYSVGRAMGRTQEMEENGVSHLDNVDDEYGEYVRIVSDEHATAPTTQEQSPTI